MYQVATDALQAMEKAMERDGIHTNDRCTAAAAPAPDRSCRQLACARIQSREGQDYLAAMAAAANFAWVNRSSMTFLARQAHSLCCFRLDDACVPLQAFAKVFDKGPEELDMHVGVLHGLQTG